MKNLVLGIGLSALALPTADAMAGHHHRRTLDDWRTMQANLSRPAVHVKHHYTSVMPYNGRVAPYHPHYKPYYKPAHKSQRPLLPMVLNDRDRVPTIFPHEPLLDTKPTSTARGWQRAAKIAPRAINPAKRPVTKRMYAFVGPTPELKPGQKIHTIVGNAQPMCPINLG